jgi:hypothetical protein
MFYIRLRGKYYGKNPSKPLKLLFHPMADVPLLLLSPLSLSLWRIYIYGVYYEFSL